jgi:hypothetical protein
MSDKRTTLDVAVASIESGMTIGNRRLGVSAQADGVRSRVLAHRTSPTSPW